MPQPNAFAAMHALWQAEPARRRVALALEGGTRWLDGAQLTELSRRAAGALAALGVGPGDRVALILPTCEAFLAAFLGAWWLGATAVPLAPPMPRLDPSHEQGRLARALQLARPQATVAPGLLAPWFQGLPGFLAAEALAQGQAHPGPLDPEGAPALVQFSSGSTGHPKGVVLGHEQLLANAALLAQATGLGREGLGVSWLPLHHDMGLIGAWLATQLADQPVVLLAPERFLTGPARWLQALGEHRATHTLGPTFGYALAAKLAPAATEGLDLSALRVALVGAEPVTVQALEAFTRRFAPQGFDPLAFVPTYGLAEATLGVTMSPPGQGAKVAHLSREALREDHQARPCPPGSPEARPVVSLGPPLPGVGLVLRDEAGQPLPEGQVGEVFVSGPSVMRGYLGQEPQGPWLATGDLGFLQGGALHLVGRSKDLIVRAGRKFHASDLELIAQEGGAVRPGGLAAFVLNPTEGLERVVLVAEPHPRVGPEALEAAAEGLRAQVQEATGLRLDEVVWVSERQVPRTTSGKVRRLEARDRYLHGQLELLRPPC